MAQLFRLGRRFLPKVPSLAPRVARSHGISTLVPAVRTPAPLVIKRDCFATLDPAFEIEEENTRLYENGCYYPVKLGEVFNSRYHVLGKLGFGVYSTVWFCRDLISHRYVALKIYIHHSKSRREVDILKYLASLEPSKHPGQAKFRKMLDAFDINGPVGEHPCLVHEPMLMSAGHLQNIFVDHRYPEIVLKQLLMQVLIALDYLHSEAHVIHTDIQSRNILVGTTDSTVFDDWDRQEMENPTPRKVVDGRIIYKSRNFTRKQGWKAWGLPILSDFGTSRIADGDQEGIIHPYIYRAPEVVLGMKWNEKVDIWNIGVVDFLERRHMFDGHNPRGGESSVAHLLAEMVALLGPPPVEYLKRSEKSWEYWDESGTWRGVPLIPEISLEKSEVYLKGENKKLFMQFMREMLTWDPEERYSARDLL